ncbi:MAG: phosphoglucosamine mutase [Selenomonadaceae bacterium]|jgi:phosphoglucosamine mutase|uniref:Phosphoglucosamine mutase n=2 Tax=Selenomonas TaxID=970 RepID=A0A848B984_9FIRM|nr:phosphoglucosamine mutase [Selenomonas bovis]MBQ1622683.1 phosphoglucosamine mutase [Selenomonas sp.]MDY6273051.1 phosphoglucosamine mutase [Selenomonadaceae bacterium]MCI6170976.1 phosphoglucosamine mutase [Selenomonas bovis]MCI6752454.1 phosphoglucosamine mutase [Selenomonas bovis]MCI7056133.1 phosphoglucosamine mutase [Selenomonas bovis]
MARLFGTDGVRGEANVTLLPEMAYRLGRAATLYFGRESDEQPLILIGRDTRISGEMFASALTAGICSAGGRAMLAGVIPTPAIAYLARRHKAKAGIVISASHNPFHDNGIKFFGGDGYKLPDAVEDELEAIVHQLEQDDNLARPSGDKIGHIEYRTDLLNQYIEFVLSTCKERFDGMSVVLDCANGAAYEVMPRVLRELGAKVKVIHALPNGVNINDHCGSTHLESLQRAVLENHADFGIAHDGDADRCLCVDEKGQVIDGDHILVMCAQDMIKKGTLPYNTVVTTVMANIGFHKAIKAAGGRAEVTQVGDRYVLENMLKNGYKIGGEQSGHIIFTDFSTTGDGPITALQVLSSLKRSGRKASDLTNLMTTYPQLLVNVKVATKDGWEENEAIKAAIAAGEQELGSDGRILVRPSGTEPLIRVMAEGPDQAQLDTICHRIADVVKKEQG